MERLLRSLTYNGVTKPAATAKGAQMDITPQEVSETLAMVTEQNPEP